MDKISTSIQYQLTNVKLFNDIFGNFPMFDQILKSGTDNVKQYLFDQWNEVKKIVANNDNIEIKDIDKEVTLDDFNVTFNRTQNGSAVFFFTFPDYDYHDVASKYVALAITPKGLRYLTYEYSENFMTKETQWFIGEFYISDGKISHKNYGKGEDDRLSWFAGFVIGLLENEGL